MTAKTVFWLHHKGGQHTMFMLRVFFLLWTVCFSVPEACGALGWLPREVAWKAFPVKPVRNNWRAESKFCSTEAVNRVVANKVAFSEENMTAFWEKLFKKWAKPSDANPKVTPREIEIFLRRK